MRRGGKQRRGWPGLPATLAARAPAQVLHRDAAVADRAAEFGFVRGVCSGLSLSLSQSLFVGLCSLGGHAEQACARQCPVSRHDAEVTATQGRMAQLQVRLEVCHSPCTLAWSEERSGPPPYTWHIGGTAAAKGTAEDQVPPVAPTQD